MAEFAIAVQSMNELQHIESPWESFPHLNEIETEMQQLFFKEWENVFTKHEKPTRIYFGSEFCQYRLQPLSTIKKALDYCWTNGYEFTYATPYVHGAKYEQLTEILSYLNERVKATGKSIEVVVNDWGIFHVTQKNYPHLELAIGRLLNKTIRDPRVANYYNDSKAPEKGKSFFKQSGLLSKSFSQFLNKGKIASIEFDELIQGYEWSDEAENSYKTTFHYPFGTVASGSACMVGFLESEKKEKFRGDPNCKQQCQKYVFELKNRYIPEMDTKVFQKGNTAFYSYKKEMMTQGLHQINEMKNSRVVYSLRIPV